MCFGSVCLLACLFACQMLFMLDGFGRFSCRAESGIKIINQLDDDVFTTVIKYVHKHMSLSEEHADVDDDGGLEK